MQTVPERGKEREREREREREIKNYNPLYKFGSTLFIKETKLYLISHILQYILQI